MRTKPAGQGSDLYVTDGTIDDWTYSGDNTTAANRPQLVVTYQ